MEAPRREPIPSASVADPRPAAPTPPASAARDSQLDHPLRRGSRLPSLDGWRALSILLVLGAHSRLLTNFPRALDPAFSWLFDGNLGVRCFFVLSGLLITALLLREHQMTGTLGLKRFYLRRALRILPVYYAFMAVVGLLALFGSFRQAQRSWLGNLTFTTDFTLAPLTTLHLWSLAVEEQFYLLWPLSLAAMAGFRHRRSILMTLFGAACLAAPFWRAVSYLHGSNRAKSALFSQFTVFSYLDSLALGCACAFLLVRSEHAAALVRLRSAWAVRIAVAAVLLPHLLRALSLWMFFVKSLGPLLQGIGLAILILWSIDAPAARFVRFLNTRAMIAIGVLSYSIYIWHTLFCTRPAAFGATNLWWYGFPQWLVPVFTVAVASYYLLEMPLLRLRSRLRRVDQLDVAR